MTSVMSTSTATCIWIAAAENIIDKTIVYTSLFGRSHRVGSIIAINCGIVIISIITNTTWGVFSY